MLALFPDLEEATADLTDEQFGRLMRSAFSYRFRGEIYNGEDIAVKISFRFVRSQIDRYEEQCATNSNNAKGSKESAECSETEQNNGEQCEIEGNYPHNHTHNPITTMSGKPDCAPSFCMEVVDFLNQTAGKSYRSNAKKTVKFIEERRNEGFTLEDFKKVIIIKTAQWRGTNMDGYLRPETLFGTKFEGYLQEAESRHQQEQPKQADIDWSLVDYGPEEASR